MMGRTSVRSKTGLSERAGKRRNERSKRQERFKNGNFTEPHIAFDGAPYCF